MLSARRLAYSTVAALAVFIAAALIVFACTAEYTRKARVSGYLAPDKGLLKIHAPEIGTVVERLVEEGELVERGEVLFVVSTERGSKSMPRARQAAIAKLDERRTKLGDELAQQARIDELDARRLDREIESTARELAQIEDEISSQHERVTNAARTAKRFADLLARAHTSALEAERSSQDLLEQRIRLKDVQRERTGLERSLESLRIERASLDMRAANRRSQIERDIAALEQELTEHEARRSIAVTAPADGTVTTILAEPGQRAELDTPLASMLPAGATLQAQLLVPSRAIGFVAAGQSVALRYQAFPYQRFGSYRGSVANVSQTIILPGEIELPVPLTEPVYRATVALERQTVLAYRNEVGLQPGMLLDADIRLDRRRIVEWLLEPLYSLKGRL